MLEQARNAARILLGNENPERVEEIAAQVVFQVLQTARRSGERLSKKPLEYFKVTALSVLRKRAARRTLFVSGTPDVVDTRSLRRPEGSNSTERLEALRTFVASQPQRTRDIFELLCLGKNVREVAEEQGVTVQTVYGHRHKIAAPTLIEAGN